MNNRNDPEAAIGWTIFAAVAMVGLFLFFIAGILSLVLTLVCIWAWNEERELFGETITPTEARQFVGAGILGAMLLGMFGGVLYANDMLDEDLRGWMATAGYTIGSLGCGALMAKQQELENEKRAREAEEKRFVQANHKPTAQVPREPAREFEYASWNDERPN